MLSVILFAFQDAWYSALSTKNVYIIWKAIVDYYSFYCFSLVYSASIRKFITGMTERLVMPHEQLPQVSDMPYRRINIV